MDGGDLGGLGFGPPPLPDAVRPQTQTASVATRPAGRPLRGAEKRAASGRSGRDGGARRGGAGRMVLAGVVGFIAGAVCWHFVGFWGFMTEAVFYARSDTGGKDTGGKTSVRPASVTSAKNQNRQPGAASVTAANAACSLAVKDPAGDVQPRGCDGHTYKFQPTRNIVRADRGDFGPTPVPTLISGESVGVVAVGGWSARIEGTDGNKPPLITAPKTP